jgi:hypothetical protein
MADVDKGLRALVDAVSQAQTHYNDKWLEFVHQFKQINVKSKPSDVQKVAMAAEKTRIEMANALSAIASARAAIEKAAEKLAPSAAPIATLQRASNNYD